MCNGQWRKCSRAAQLQSIGQHQEEAKNKMTKEPIMILCNIVGVYWGCKCREERVLVQGVFQESFRSTHSH